MFEIGGIMRVLDGRFPGHFGISDIVPVELSEPGVLLDVFAVVAGPQSLSGVGVEKAQDDVSGPEGEELGKLNHSL